MRSIIIASAFIVLSVPAFAASDATKAFIANQPAIEKASIAELDGASNAKRCGASWKANKDAMSKVGWTWPRYYSACNAVLKAK